MICDLQLSECINQLLYIYGISGSKLSKSINVDPSLISKWRNGKRVISQKSNYIEIISDYLFSNTSPIQKKELIRMAKKYDIEIDTTNSNSFKKYIYDILTISNQNSMIKYGSSIFEEKPPPKTNTIFGINKKVITSDNEILKNNILPANPSNMNSYVSNSKEFQLIIGKKEVIKATLNLLKSTLDNSCSSNESILITCINELDLFSGDVKYNLEWNNTLLEILKEGWNITEIIRLNENEARNNRIINEMQIRLSTGRYYPYYLKNYHFVGSWYEFIIVPTIGALMCLRSQDNNGFDSAFLFTDEQTIQILKGAPNQILAQALPLTNPFSTQKKIDFQLAITECEERLGNKFILKNGLSTLTIPMNLYIYYLHKTKKSKAEISKRIFYHKRRLNAFVSQINDYKFYDIYSKKSIEKLVRSGKYSIDEFYISEEITAKPFEVLLHLENVIYMLENFDNYHIALLDDALSKNLTNNFCMLKDTYSVFIENQILFKDKTLEKDSSTIQNCEDKNYINILEPTIVNAFHSYFLNIWEEIAPINKDKKSVITWLKNLMKSLKN